MEARRDPAGGRESAAARREAGRRTSRWSCMPLPRRCSSAFCACSRRAMCSSRTSRESGRRCWRRRSRARSTARFSRIQFTPDLLPVRRDRRQRLQPAHERVRVPAGPVFANVLLVDEINRASPKTQAALLEAMQESQVTVDGESRTRSTGRSSCIATQNPIEYEGTYPLPEAQLDRFAMRLALGYPPLADEARMLNEQTTEPPLEIAGAGGARPRRSCAAIDEAARRSSSRRASNRYVVALLRHTRASSRLCARSEPARRDRAPARREGARARGRPRLSSLPTTSRRSRVRPRASADPWRPRRARPATRQRRRSSAKPWSRPRSRCER